VASKTSAGIIVYRVRETLEVLLVHPGGPFWAKKDDGAWFIVKGEVEPDEELALAARREFREELGTDVPEGELVSLGSLKNKSGKTIHAWAVEGDLDTTAIVSNTFQLEWPPRSGKLVDFPEVDRARFFPVEEALTKMSPAEGDFLRRLAEHLLAQR
jgi:predicted NUDIX family NTP pyrophosphohydrolase